MNDTRLMIAVAPNGARKTRVDHPALPVGADELARTAAACREAGACMIHLHVRDRQERHSLDASLYQEATKAIRDAVGLDMIIQITSEAVNRYSPEQQIEAVMQTRPEAVSLAVRELCPQASHESAVGAFFEWCYRERVHPQYILYDQADIERFRQLRRRGLIPGDVVTVLLVLGRYTDGQESDPEELPALREALGDDCVWWLCAFGASESRCMTAAAATGGHCRVGFENNLYLADGSLAPDNAALVSQVKTSSSAMERGIANADQARGLMGYRS